MYGNQIYLFFFGRNVHLKESKLKLILGRNISIPILNVKVSNLESLLDRVVFSVEMGWCSNS
jgi:hypothetical protein